MTLAFEALVPVCLLLAIGAISVRTGYLPAVAIGPVNVVVVRILVPATIFLSLFVAAKEEGFSLPFIAAYLAASLVAYGAAFLLLRGIGQASGASALRALGAAASNSIQIGYPLAILLLGPLAEVTLPFVLIVESLFILPLSFALREMATGGRRGVLRGLSRNPIVLAALAGLLVPLVLPALWSPTVTALSFLRQAVTGVALVVIGGMLVQPRRGSVEAVPLGLVVLTKLVIHPAAAWMFLTLFGVSPELRGAGVLFAAISSFGLYANISEDAGDGPFGARVFAVATLAAPITLLGWITLVGL